MLEDAELEHYGILGMKWGVRRTPEELGHKPTSERTKKGKKVVDSLGEKIKKKRIEAKRKASEKSRQKILSDPELLEKHYKEFSEEEVKNAIKNFRTEKEIRDLSRDRLKKAENFLSTMAKLTTSAIVVWNNATKSYNAFFPSEKPLPQIQNPPAKKQ